jgi:hypothetical protein
MSVPSPPLTKNYLIHVSAIEALKAPITDNGFKCEFVFGTKEDHLFSMFVNTRPCLVFSNVKLLFKHQRQFADAASAYACIYMFHKQQNDFFPYIGIDELAVINTGSVRSNDIYCHFVYQAKKAKVEILDVVPKEIADVVAHLT